MAVRASEAGAETIERVCALARAELSGADGAPSADAESFIRRLYSWVPVEDLPEDDVDLLGAALAHWRLARRWTSGGAAVAVYNPEFDRHGWSSPHTAVEIVTDDMPFLVDSVSIEIHRRGLGIHRLIHPVMPVRAGADGTPALVAPGESEEGARRVSVIHVDVDQISDPAERRSLVTALARVLDQVRAAVEDWEPMLATALALAEEVATHGAPGADAAENREVRDFLRWLAEDHYTFLGYRDYDLLHSGDGGDLVLRAVPGSGLGILRGEPEDVTRLPVNRREFALSPHHLVLTKANSKSTIHRPTYLDYVGVKRFDEDGTVAGERRFLGLYTSATYKASPADIPLLRGKLATVLGRANFAPRSHDRKALTSIVEAYPRDSLFQIGSEELFDVAMGILALGERQRVRLFLRRDPLDRFVSCLVYIPRDRFNTENRERIGELLLEAFGSDRLDWGLLLSESVNVRVHYVIHCDSGVPEVDGADVERRLVRAVRAWADDLRVALSDEHDEQRAALLYDRYAEAFPASYRADHHARAAVADIGRIERLARSGGPEMCLRRTRADGGGDVRCTLVSATRLPLSEVLPRFEHMGVRVLDERPYAVTPRGAEPAWVYDFGLSCPVDGDLDDNREVFQEAFLGVWHGELEDDGLGALVLRAGLTGREVAVLRAIVKYLRQGGMAFTEGYIQRTLIDHSEIAALLLGLMSARLDPDRRGGSRADALAQRIATAIDEVESLDEDRILRAFLSVVQATVRTNAYCRQRRTSVAIKVMPEEISLLPRPRPRFEIFVYSPRVEGVHLRGGLVARGGLRWSDRREDFRTEILGLMKAQMVKNALIVPVGSKGGFVVKRPPADGDREAVLAEAIECYRIYLHGLLDLTDNIVGGEITPPSDIVRLDGDDPYLVVAADKGTASFSDVANEVSAEYGFWLGDAFASGGSRGYDHKQMGITARGAWESVKRHFRELGTDVQAESVTVVGIGDMSGDVFGNGMLLSRHLKLVAAFNHQHVFLDPDPDPERSWQERRRLFEQPRSSWADYSAEVLSEGGQIVERAAKRVALSPQIRERLGIDAAELSPSELIRAVLTAHVDLLWNGGVGTYVKASHESHAEVGDKAGDALRVDGKDLGCRVVGEGGNLGFTQAGRIEYALAGGRINTDAIDNVAGVNCSDHEVNIKILLDAVVAAGDMTEKQRNALLVEMTDAVADRVIEGCYSQTQALSIAGAQAPGMLDVHARLIRELESVAGLDRAIEGLPSDDVIAERSKQHTGLAAPELAVIMAYCKIHLYSELLASDLPEDAYLGHDLQRYFPPPLPERFDTQMQEHRLRREIIATVVANQLVDRAGITFAFRLCEETGAPPAQLARAYAVAREIYDMRGFWAAVAELDGHVDAQTQINMLLVARRLVERSTRWLIRAATGSIEIAATVARYAGGAELLAGALPAVLAGADREAFDERRDELRAAGVPEKLAARVAAMPALLAALDTTEVADVTGREPELVVTVHFAVGAGLELDWLRDRIAELPRGDRWQALARAALRDDLFSLQRSLTQEILESTGDRGEEAVETWIVHHMPAVQRALGMIADIRSARVYDTTTLPVALREVRNLVGVPRIS